MRFSSRDSPAGRGFSIELLSLLYLLSYIPGVTLTRWLASVPYAPLGRPLTGLEVLPATTILSGLLTYLFVWASGWWREAHSGEVLGVRLPLPTRWTLLSGIGAALLLCTVPLSFTFRGVSIPFMQLLMRGDVLIVAPLVDLLLGRRVRWYSWVALALVGLGLCLTIHARGGLRLPPLAIATVVLYTVGFLIRLLVMTKIAKSGDARSNRGYFVEEKLVAIPLALIGLALFSVCGIGAQGNELSFGFVAIWTSGRMTWMCVLSVLMFVVSVFSILILLDRRENTYCVPLERSASVLAGIAATYVLAGVRLSAAPTAAELAGALLLVLAIALLSLAPRLTSRSPARLGLERRRGGMMPDRARGRHGSAAIELDARK